MLIANLADLKWVREKVTHFQFPGLSLNRRLRHGVFTRQGGVSNPPFDTLNISCFVGDRPEDVAANTRKIKDVFRAKDLLHMNQSHGDGIFALHKGEPGSYSEVPCADAMITNIPGVAILVKQADCQGIIIYDPKKHVVANVHCGWRGSVQNILASVVIRMKEEFGSKESDLVAAIGPSLGSCCGEFVSYRDIFPIEFERFMVRENYFDLWSVSCWQLEQVGLRAENIEVAGICTSCRTDLFYSYRGEGKTGRFGSVVMLQ